jgi:anaerobilin synthase
VARKLEDLPGAPAAFALAEAGVNRVALGVQSFDTAFRRSLGRSTPGEEILAPLERIRGAMIGDVCVDLLYGLPGQTLEWATEDLRVAR